MPCSNTWKSDLKGFVSLVWSSPLIGLYISNLCRVSGCLPKTWQREGKTEGAELKKWIFFFFPLRIASLAESVVGMMHFRQSQQRQEVLGVFVSPPCAALFSPPQPGMIWAGTGMSHMHHGGIRHLLPIEMSA